MKNLVINKTTVALSIATLLAACGGGSGGSSSPAAPAALNLNAAYKSLIQGGDSVLYTLAGDCTGYSSQTALPAYDFKNWATPAVDVWAVDNVQFDTLSTASQASAGCTKLFNSNSNEVNREFYSPTNQTVVNSGGSGSYWTIYAEQNPMPTSVSAGSTGTLYTWKNYMGASSTAGNPVYTGTVNYSVKADTATTLLVDIIETSTEVATGKPAWTATKTYRLNANNSLTNLSFSIVASANSPINANIAVTGSATSAITLNAQAAKVASLNSGASYQFKVFDGSGNQCSPNLTQVFSALSSTGGTTSKGVVYAKSNTTTFNPQTFTGQGNCSSFNMPVSENTYYDVNYALVQQTSNNNGSSSTNIAASSVPLPSAVTIGNTGQQYTFNRYGSSTTPFASGNVIYYVGALTPNKLAFFDVQTKNYTDGSRAGRQIFVHSAESNNGTTPFYGYVNDGGTLYLIPTN